MSMSEAVYVFLFLVQNKHKQVQKIISDNFPEKLLFNKYDGNIIKFWKNQYILLSTIQMHLKYVSIHLNPSLEILIIILLIRIQQPNLWSAVNL